jgi:hypothetical protein
MDDPPPRDLRLLSLCALVSVAIRACLSAGPFLGAAGSLPGRTLFVIGDPAEAATFFGPAILRAEAAFVLSVSGGARARPARFYAACQVLRAPGRCFVDRSGALPAAAAWAAADVRALVRKYAELLRPARIVTFDPDGDPHHAALWRSLRGRGANRTEPLGVPVYTLRQSAGGGAPGFLAVTPVADILSMRIGAALLEHSAHDRWRRVAALAASRLTYFNHLVPARS